MESGTVARMNIKIAQTLVVADQFTENLLRLLMLAFNVIMAGKMLSLDFPAGPHSPTPISPVRGPPPLAMAFLKAKGRGEDGYIS